MCIIINGLFDKQTWRYEKDVYRSGLVFFNSCFLSIDDETGRNRGKINADTSDWHRELCRLVYGQRWCHSMWSQRSCFIIIIVVSSSRIFSFFPDDNDKNTIGNRTEAYFRFSFASTINFSPSFLFPRSSFLSLYLSISRLLEQFSRNVEDRQRDVVCSSNQFSSPVSAHQHASSAETTESF